MDKTDIYWVNNRKNRVEDVDATFRVDGREAEIWHPESGETEPASYSIINGSTNVKLHLQPNDAVFVVFRNKAREKSREIPAVNETTIATITGPWNISFQSGRGAPEKTVFDTLMYLNDNSEPGIKYFSGTATYSTEFNIDNSNTGGSKIMLDLGSVKNIAEVIINGKSAGIVWKTPFVVNITNDIKAGQNSIEIKVSNLWVNRLIGDQQPGVKEKITYTTMPFYQANSPLMASGLGGPVVVKAIK
jgi:hypothetical protein